jgi:hypothetical protein
MCHIHLHSLCPFNGGVPALTAAVQYKKNCKQVFNKLMWAKKWIYKLGKCHVLYRVAKRKYISFECVPEKQVWVKFVVWNSGGAFLYPLSPRMSDTVVT